MKTFAAIFALFIASAFAEVDTSRTALPPNATLETGSYLLVCMTDSQPGSGEFFPYAIPVTVKEEGGDFVILFSKSASGSDYQVSITRTGNGMLFQTVQKSKDYYLTTIYTASFIHSVIQGKFFTINGGGGMAFQGVFSLQKLK